MRLITFSIIFVLFISYISALSDDHNHTRATYRNGYLTLVNPDGKVSRIKSPGDLDEDGIADTLEVNGFTFSVNNGLQPWNGNENETYYRTDPLRWSTDGDPYSDFMEVTGVNMPAGVPAPYNHPLVAARPVVSVDMLDYDVIPISEITNSSGGSESSSFTNSTTNTDQVGGEISVEAELNPFKLVGGSVTASYSHTWTRTKSTTSAFGTNWNNTRSTNPSMAARLKLRIFMKNLGSATALDVSPTFNLILGGKTLATITPDQIANRLEPKWLDNNRYPADGTIAVEKDNNDDYIILTLEELKAIQSGAPLSLVVTQVDANVVRWDSDSQSFDSKIAWTAFESEIDPVSVKVYTNLGDDQQESYDVYVGTDFNDPGYTFRDVLSLIYNVTGSDDNIEIENRKYPDKWYVSTSDQTFIQEWENAGQPQNLMDLKVFRNGDITLLSPGSDPNPVIDFASYSPDFKKVYVVATPNNFPLISATARLTFHGKKKDIELNRDPGQVFFTNAQPFEVPAAPAGLALVENARGDVSKKTIAPPALYTSAADVKNYSSFLPNPGSEYLLFLDGDTEKPMLIYCLFFDPVTGDTLPQPLEYLTLPQSGDSINFSDYRRGGFFDVGYSYKIRVYFDKLRLNLPDLTVESTDHRFTHIDTFYWYAGKVEPNGARYGYVSESQGKDTAYANIDLQGTPFQVNQDVIFDLRSSGALQQDQVSGEHRIDSLRQVVDIELNSNISDEVSSASYGWTSEFLQFDYLPDNDLTTAVTLDRMVGQIPEIFKLFQNYPNPFNPSTTIRYQLPVSSRVALSVYNLIGQKVAVLVSKRQPAGSYRVIYNAQNQSSGIYFYKLDAGNFHQVKRMLYVK